jgi:putative flippase GtrA
MRSAHLPEFVRFISVGLFNTLIGLLTIYGAKFFFNFDDVHANIIGYCIGFLSSFALNSRWTFRYQGAQLPALVRFLVVALVAYGMNLLTVLLAIRVLGMNGYFAQALGIPPYTLTSYLASRYLVFNDRTSGRHVQP